MWSHQIRRVSISAASSSARGYWLEAEIQQGQGEVEDLYWIAREVEQEWRIDPDRRHIVGLSSGGLMANAAAVAFNEYWASAGVHSGGGFNEEAATFSAVCATPRETSGTFRSPTALSADMRSEMDSDYRIPVLLLHSTNDCTVGFGREGDHSEWGGLTANREAWLAINGGSLVATSDCTRDGIACSHARYGGVDRATVEVVALHGLTDGTNARTKDTIGPVERPMVPGRRHEAQRRGRSSWISLLVILG